MFDGTSRPKDAHRLQRAQGRAQVGFSAGEPTSRLAHLYQSGCCKVRLPKVYGSPPEAVFLNTAGGLTGGDQVDYQAALDKEAQAIFTSQACERIYKSSGSDAMVENCLTVNTNGYAEWLPQETILFDGGRLDRIFTVDLKAGASLLALEAIIFGRTAMGEEVRHGALRDRWRVRQEGHVIYADETRIEGDIAAQLDRPMTLGGARAMASIVMIAPNAEEKVGPARQALETQLAGGRAGVSYVNGCLVTRIVATTGQDLRRALFPLLSVLRQGAPLPRVWHT